MTDHPKHTKLTTYIKQEDGTLKAITESYFEELATRQEDVIVKVKTDHINFLSDVISCLDVISQQKVKKLQLTITVNNRNQPDVIVKQYTVYREDFDRRHRR